ncbi:MULTISPECIES: bifunctional diaminohydroxyphosphoribosylaminopyrimidine deaminase/5-amino-6-(5-phosphoribosylamino)uracil reductase RibD [unclassified Vibrio]|uniref:Riboflavin biosynthesis protein RibD n=1 Tax=Vibrio sp. HB236076 TaxID=3232307 RepID=A0AB39H875_9VIBR|nr:bifunctional diaminohydroxyphosphoribosylaminopyrimidine deaminase/5-amino-6-(5-phosphoribosylamino)uracil reductase RibD [Vibrio sp. HB161653]MDP5254175.1 bifunctional diaminohydroxyphosphoribosylaminopyrimidine deaminase/5-amino-6-(5-phosphoribosylamino)uracil reductase RibD [Vibrio sp. HB161653]
MTTFTLFDHQMMAKAIELARAGVYTTSPNPNVGCVIVQDQTIVGQGFHFQAGHPHAEVHALREAGELAAGATVYVTLEPCSHYGRTPPCAKGLIDAKVKKVICAMQDPNPQVAGRGIAMLREAGIEVEVGLLESQAKALNLGFIKKMQSGMPYVQLKMAASLDGQSALSNGQSQWITSSDARRDVQKFRAKSGAILSTSKTVIADNASLNVRWSQLPPSVQAHYHQDKVRQPTRVILDRCGRLSSDLKLYQHEGDILTVGGENADILAPCKEDGFVDLTSLLSILSQAENINHLWVEAGATLAGSLLKAKLVDQLVIYLAPKLMGSDGRGLLGALGLTQMQDVINLHFDDVRLVGRDIRIIASIDYKE